MEKTYLINKLCVGATDKLPMIIWMSFTLLSVIASLNGSSDPTFCDGTLVDFIDPIPSIKIKLILKRNRGIPEATMDFRI